MSSNRRRLEKALEEEARRLEEIAECTTRRDECRQVPDVIKDEYLALEDTISPSAAEAIWEFMKAVKKAKL